MTRRWRGAEPPWGQAAANTNQPYFIRPSGQRKWLRWPIRWQRRGEYWSGPYFQAAENTNGYLIRHNPQRKWIRIPSRWFGRGLYTAAPYFQAAANTNQPVFVPPSGQRKWLRLPPRQWGRGRAPAPPWFQATGPANPAFVEWWRRHGLRALLTIRRGRLISPTIDQAPAPAPTRQRRGRLTTVRRSRPGVPMRSEEQPRKYSAPRRPTAFRTRARVMQPPVAQATQPQAPAFNGWFRRSRRALEIRRRGSYRASFALTVAPVLAVLQDYVDSVRGVISAISTGAISSAGSSSGISSAASLRPPASPSSTETGSSIDTEVQGR